MKRTYIDSSILITTFQGKEPDYKYALSILDDPERELVVNDYLKLKVLPKPVFHKRHMDKN